MNVLHLIHRYPPVYGGAERYFHEVGRRLVAEGHQVTVYTSNVVDGEGFWKREKRRLSAGVERMDGVRVERFPAWVLPWHGYVTQALARMPWSPVRMALASPGLVLPGLWWRLRQSADFDVVVATSYPSLMYLGAHVAQRSGAALILMPCLHLGAPGDKKVQDYYLGPSVICLYNQADAILTQTYLERQVLIDHGVTRERIAVTRAGVDPRPVLEADGQRFRARYGLPPSATLVAFVGYKTANKGAMHAVQAIQRLSPDRPDLYLALAGQSDDAFAAFYRDLPAGVRAHVLNLDDVSEPDKHDLLAAATVFVAPSKADSFGIVYLEAWLHGLPVIGALAGGVPEVIQHGVDGLLVPYGDVEAIASALSFLLDHPDQAAEMGRQGRVKTLRDLTWDLVYPRIREVYLAAWRRYVNNFDLT